MEVITLERPMAKKMGRPKGGRNDGTAKIDAELLRKAKYLALYEGKTLAEWLTENLEPIVDRKMRQVAATMVDKPK